MALADRIGHARPQRIGQADQSQKFESEFARCSGQVCSPTQPSQRPTPAIPGGHRINSARQRGPIGSIEATKAGDRFGRPLGSNEEMPRRRRFKRGSRREAQAEAHKRGPVSIAGRARRRCWQDVSAQGMKCLVHGVKRLGRTGQKAVSSQNVQIALAFCGQPPRAADMFRCP